MTDQNNNDDNNKPSGSQNLEKLRDAVTERVEEIRKLQDQLDEKNIQERVPLRESLSDAIVTSEDVPDKPGRKKVVVDVRRLSPEEAAFLVRRTREAQLRRLERASEAIDKRIGPKKDEE